MSFKTVAGQLCLEPALASIRRGHIGIGKLGFRVDLVGQGMTGMNQGLMRLLTLKLYNVWQSHFCGYPSSYESELPSRV